MQHLILAGNYHQARNFAREHQWQPRDWIYVDDVYRIRGLRDYEVHYVGTWKENPATPDIMLELHVQKGKN